jgi:hypothetical protein
MRSFLSRLATVATAAFLLFAPHAARADTVTLVLQDSGTPTTYYPNGGDPVTIGAGPFHWTQAAPINPTYPDAFRTYCIDLDQYVYQGQTFTFTAQENLALAPTIGSPEKAVAVTELFDRGYLNSLTSTANGTAFQLALWDLVYDGATSRDLTT